MKSSMLGFLLIFALSAHSQPGDVKKFKSKLGLDSSLSLNQITASETGKGWELLWDGKTFQGWGVFMAGTLSDHWRISNGEISSIGTQWDFDLKTNQRYDNFIWSIEWKNTTRDINSGLIYWALDTLDSPSFATGPEMQILGKTARYYDAYPKNRAGSSYDLFASTFGGADLVGSYYDATQPEPNSIAVYNHAVIIVNGLHHQYYLNGIKIVDFTVDSERFNSAKAISKWRTGGSYPHYAKFRHGHVVLQNHGAGATFRNIKIKRLPINASEKTIWPEEPVSLAKRATHGRLTSETEFFKSEFYSFGNWFTLTGQKRSIAR